MAANTVVTCLPTDGHCDENNNTSDLGYVDDGSMPGAIDSSLADLDLPAGATVLNATLQLGRRTRPAPPTTRPPPSGPSPSSCRAARRRSSTPTRRPLQTPDEAYSASADVTELIRSPALARPAPTRSPTCRPAPAGTSSAAGACWSPTGCPTPRCRRWPCSTTPATTAALSRVKDGLRVRAARLRRRRAVGAGRRGRLRGRPRAAERPGHGGRAHAGERRTTSSTRRSTWAVPPGSRPRRTSTGSTPSCSMSTAG